MRIINPIGKKGENIAAEYLKKKGYQILERNFRKGYGEIDIICTKNNVLVFVEVKTRTSNSYGAPLESITHWKLKPLLKTAQYFSMLHPELPEQLRLDAISVIIDNTGKSIIEHVENISGF